MNDVFVSLFEVIKEFPMRVAIGKAVHGGNRVSIVKKKSAGADFISASIGTRNAIDNFKISWIRLSLDGFLHFAPNDWIRMEYREIEVTLISAQNLKKVNAFGRMTVYGVVWIYPNMKVATPVDTRGHLNPTWNSTLKLTADERLVQDRNAVVHIDLYNHGSLGSNFVGSSSIPLSGVRVVKDEVDPQVESSSSGANVMTVPVVRRSGRVRGTLTLSVRLGELINHPPYAPPTVAYPPGYGAAQPYPINQQAPYYPYGGYAPPPPPQRYGLGGGFGTGLLGGALGGLLLGSILGDGGGFGGCGGF